jgi:hypothetical protein
MLRGLGLDTALPMFLLSILMASLAILLALISVDIILVQKLDNNKPQSTLVGKLNLPKFPSFLAWNVPLYGSIGIRPLGTGVKKPSWSNCEPG